MALAVNAVLVGSAYGALAMGQRSLSTQIGGFVSKDTVEALEKEINSIKQVIGMNQSAVGRFLTNEKADTLMKESERIQKGIKEEFQTVHREISEVLVRLRSIEDQQKEER